MISDAHFLNHGLCFYQTPGVECLNLLEVAATTANGGDLEANLIASYFITEVNQL